MSNSLALAVLQVEVWVKVDEGLLRRGWRTDEPQKLLRERVRGWGTNSVEKKKMNKRY